MLHPHIERKKLKNRQKNEQIDRKYTTIIILNKGSKKKKKKRKSKNGVAVEMDRKNAANFEIAWRHKIYGYLLFHCCPMLTNFNGSKDTRIHTTLY